jgi:hypothetical protein
VTRLVLLIFSFLIYATMFGMRPVHFYDLSIKIFTPMYAFALLLCLVGMFFTAIASSLQGICCRAREEGGLCCVQKCMCCRAELAGTPKAEIPFWNIMYAIEKMQYIVLFCLFVCYFCLFVCLFVCLFSFSCVKLAHVLVGL